MASRYSHSTRGGRVKKKHSFLVKARKYGKKGLYGRGKNVDEETYNYFVRVMERLKEEFDDDEEKGTFCLCFRWTPFLILFFTRNVCRQRI